MMRPIDGDALFRKVKTECNPYGKPTIGFEDGNRVMNWIEQAPTVATDTNVLGKWISVKDRLPTSVVNKVLVWLEHEDLNGYLGFGHYEKYKGQEIWYDLEHNEAFSIRGYAVTHWMPLPEPPKEVGGDDAQGV